MIDRRFLRAVAFALAMALPAVALSDAYDRTKDGWSGTAAPSVQARHVIAVTPSDTKDVTNSTGDAAPNYAKALYVGVTGDVAIVAAGDNGNSGNGTSVTFKAVPVGWFPIQVRRIMATGTTATNIVGLYD